MKDSELRFARFLVLVNGAVPVTLLGWDAWHHKLGANPVNFAILTTGMSALVFLMLTLLVTPLRKISGWSWIISFRRTLGLYSFFYASCHFLIFFSLDRSFSVSGTLSEMLKRKYLFVGITGLLVMVPLAITSTNAMIKRLGGKRWRALHRLVYVAAIAGVIHYYMQVKADVRQPLAFASVLAILLGYRLLVFWRRPRPVPAATTVVTQRFLPSNRSEWLGVLSRPFQTYIFVAIFFYLYCLDQWQGTTRQVGRLMRDDGLAFFSAGYFVSFIALTIIAIVQALSGKRRAAFWNAAFAVASLVAGFGFMLPNVH